MTEPEVLTPGDLGILAPKLLAFFRRRISNQHDAEDCAAECISIVWSRRDKAPQATADLVAWSYGVARKILLAYRRKHSRDAQMMTTLELEIETAHGPDVELRLALAGALASLKQRDSDLVLLVGWEGLTVQQAGAVVGLKPPAARAAYSRARQLLRASLSGSEVSPRTMSPAGTTTRSSG